MISDTHFGLRNGSQEWVQIVRDYFYEFFIPLLKREKQDGDILVHCGDVFDSRHSLNLLIMNDAINIFEELSKIMPIVIILGNHDLYRKNSNEVNSVKVLKWMPNVKIIEEPEVINIGGKTFLFMPWRANHQEEMDCINSNSADFLFCHTDIQGLKFNRKTVIEEGLDLKNLSQFKKIYAGHIHYSQKKGNFRMLGCPYPMTRSDINNEKGVWCFNIDTEEEIYFENNFSPKFMRYNFEKLLDMEESDVKKLFKNNFIDIIIDPTWSLNFSFSAFSEDITGYRKLDFIPRVTDSEDDEISSDSDSTQIEKIDIMELSKRVISNTKHSDTIKEKLLANIKLVYEKVQKNQDTKSNE